MLLFSISEALASYSHRRGGPGAQGSSQRLAERIARPLVPGVMILAAAIAVVGSLVGDPEVWIERALVVLVAAAPCAFASVPSPWTRPGR